MVRISKILMHAYVGVSFFETAFLFLGYHPKFMNFVLTCVFTFGKAVCQPQALSKSGPHSAPPHVEEGPLFQ